LEHGGDAKHFSRSNYSVLTHACYQPPSPEKAAIVRKLHEAGASLDAASDYGEFPLGVCLYFGDLGTMRVLLELGAKPGPMNWALTRTHSMSLAIRLCTKPQNGTMWELHLP